MNVENDTDREVEYEQTGGSGGWEVPGASQTRGGGQRSAACGGPLPAKGKASFPPCGPPPWTVSFRRNGEVLATSPPIPASGADSTVRLGVIVIP